MNKYRNLWHNGLNIKKPEFYENNARLIGEYRGVKVFKTFEHGYDFVFAGACITQRAGASKFKEVIEELFNGLCWSSKEVVEHLRSNGINVPNTKWNK